MKALKNIKKRFNVAKLNQNILLDSTFTIYNHEHKIHKRIKCYAY